MADSGFYHGCNYPRWFGRSPCSSSADAAFLRRPTWHVQDAHKESLTQAVGRVAASTMGPKLPVNEWSRFEAGSSAYSKPRPRLGGPEIGRISGQDSQHGAYTAHLGDLHQ